ncbi:MAG: DUF5702 domain-containing protein [Oscillospiraceae bacterium]|nr:DUF5702 domain-containing protein [Oscillospiraceae bacterium]
MKIKKLFSDIKGGVTVMVTLLIIPSILVSGTALDLARIYSTRSATENANQLAANAILTQYDALLKDVYGLFAVMEDDPILGSMLVDYINLAVLGVDGQSNALGTFRHFQGSVQPPNVEFAHGQHLENTEVLRRQIEEYMMLRGPIILLDDIKILGILDSFAKLAIDNRTIRIKQEIDYKISDLEDYYRRIFININNIHDYMSVMNPMLEDVNRSLDSINHQLSLLQSTREDWRDAFDSDSDDRLHLMSDLENKHGGIIANIRNLTSGGSVNRNWVDGRRNNDTWIPGYWGNSIPANPVLNTAVGNIRGLINSINTEFGRMFANSVRADEVARNIQERVPALESSLANSSDALRTGLTTPAGDSAMDFYRKIESFNVTTMTEAFMNSNAVVIGSVEDLLDNIGYGQRGTDLILTATELGNLSTVRFPVNRYITNRTADVVVNDGLRALSNLSPNQYWIFTEPLLRFNNATFNAYGNGSFYDLLNEWYGEDGDGAQKNSARSSIRALRRAAQQLFNRLTFTPRGAGYFDVAYGDDGNWFSGDWYQDGSTSNALDDNGQFDQLSNSSLAGDIANNLLLIAYGTQMFSNFTTSGSGSDKTISGASLNTDINYFFQSEQEFMFTGNLNSSRLNVLAVSGVILLIRFVFNYISTFIISEIRDTLNGIRKAFPKWGFLIAELARFGWALAESAVDVVALVSRQDVPLIKLKEEQWFLGLSFGALRKLGVQASNSLIVDAGHAMDVELGFFEDAIDAVLKYKDDEAFKLIDTPFGEVVTVGGGDIKFKPETMLDISYDQYVFVLLMFISSDTLAERIARLISLNMTNKRNSVFDPGIEIRGSESAMAGVEMFDLSRAITDFTITTTVDMRMLFIASQLAERGLQGGTMLIEVTNYGGY